MSQVAFFFLFHVLLYSSAFALQLPRGVPLAKASLYQPGSTFTCLDGSATIPWSRVNDDYCDCRDGSDEPGTSACPNGQFYCRDMKYMVVSLPSGYVNDNVCDCCDGSDEYENRVECPSTCSILAAAAKQAQSVKRLQIEKGHQIYREYVTQLKERKEQEQVASKEEVAEHQSGDVIDSEPSSDHHQDQPLNSEQPEGEHVRTEELQSADLPEHDQDQIDHHEDLSDSDRDVLLEKPEPPVPPTPIDYGPEDGFRMLTELPEECLEFTNQEYTYMLCPFKNVTQRAASESRTGSQTLLGNWDSWMQSPDLDASQKYEVMYYSNGLGCWNGPNRSAKVFLHCGEKNEIVSVNEPSRCEYTLELTTPAACHEHPDDILARLHPYEF